MATTMGATKLFHSKKIIIAQDANKDVGKRVQTIVVKYASSDLQGLPPGPRSPKSTRAYRCIVMKDRAQVGTSTTHITPPQSSNANIQVGGASITHDDAGCSHSHIYLPPMVTQALGVLYPLKLNQNAERHQCICDWKQQAANNSQRSPLSNCNTSKGSACIS